MSNKKQVCILGLGHFGASLARELAPSCEILALDCDQKRVNDISDEVDRALCFDIRDFNALSSVITEPFDEAVVAIGGSLEASILCTLHMKRLGIPVIRAKAQSTDHATILRSVGASHIVFPEQESALRLASQILNPNLLDFVPLAKDYRVSDLLAPEPFVGKTLIELNLRANFGIFAIAIKRKEGTFEFLPGPKAMVHSGDVLVAIGAQQDFIALPDRVKKM